MVSNNQMVSIIVPIYNAEHYLNDCLLSIRSQTYIDIEVILIDDGSTDSSTDIAKSFCEKDDRFKLITQVNSGVAAAREKGLRAAQGEFIIHTDSDDLMAKRSIEYLYKSITDNESDIAVGAYTIINNCSNKLITHSIDDNYSFICNILTGEYHSSLCNKLIRTRLCKGITFDKNLNYMEDKLFLAKILKKDGLKISVTNENVYYYRQVISSYTNNITNESVSSSVNVTNQVCIIYQDIYSDSLIAHIKNKNKVVVLLNSKLTQRNTFPESIKYLLDDNRIPLKHKFIIYSDLLHMNFLISFYKFLSFKKQFLF